MQRLNLSTHLVSLAVLLAFAPLAAGKIIYVDDDAAGANDGSSWDDAYNCLQDALADANSASKPVEIRVAEGIYTPDRNSANPTGTGDREATFQLIDGVSLKGGYAGLGEPDPNERDVDVYETILSGDLNANDIDVNRAYELRDEPSRKENSYHLIASAANDQTAILDGFAIIGAHGSGIHSGGIHSTNSSATIINCTFRGNYGRLGGAVYNEGGHLTLHNCTFSGNYGDWSGGGMHNEQSSPTLTNCTFSQNLAEEGGGMHNYRSNPRLNSCIFIANRVFYDGGGMSNRESNPVLVNCTFSENVAPYDGAAMYSEYSGPALMNCTFSGNWAYFAGGGMWNSSSNLVLVDCTFRQNSGGTDGGALFNELSTLEMTKCAFIDNSAESGGAIFNSEGCNTALNNCIFSANFALGGVAIGNSSSRLRITNCSFIANKHPENDTWRYEDRYTLVCSTFQEYHSSTDVANCIFWNGGREIFNRDAGSTVRISYCDMQGGRAAIHDPCEGVVWGEGNIDADPCFVDPGYWHDNGTPDNPWDDFWVDGDYHLKSQAGRGDANEGRWTKDDVTSPCIDAGNPMSPIGREPFPNGGVINMGAYGGTQEASKSYFGEPVCETIVAGDIDGDCKIDFGDFHLMALHWLEEH